PSGSKSGFHLSAMVADAYTLGTRIPSQGRRCPKSDRQGWPVLVYILRRGAFGVVAFFVASFLVFAGVRLIPGDVVDLRMTEAGYSQGEKDAFRAQLGLTGPL